MKTLAKSLISHLNTLLSAVGVLNNPLHYPELIKIQFLKWPDIPTGFDELNINEKLDFAGLLKHQPIKMREEIIALLFRYTARQVRNY